MILEHLNMLILELNKPTLPYQFFILVYFKASYTRPDKNLSWELIDPTSLSTLIWLYVGVTFQCNFIAITFLSSVSSPEKSFYCKPSGKTKWLPYQFKWCKSKVLCNFWKVNFEFFLCRYIFAYIIFRYVTHSHNATATHN